MASRVSYYDAVILGGRLGPLCCAGLLAKRGFRVLVVTGDEAPPSYVVDGLTLPREPFTLLAAHSPVARRIFAELALQQSFRQQAHTLDPPIAFALPGHRFELPSDGVAQRREISREFPRVRRPIEDFLRRIAVDNEALDRLLSRDIAIPPSGFLERRELSRAAAHLPFDPLGEGQALLDEFPGNHPFRAAVMAPIIQASHLDRTPASTLAATRLFASWWRSPALVDGGWAGLRAMLIEKIRSLGGEVRERERPLRILTSRGAANAVQLSGAEEPVGAGFVIGGRELLETVRLLQDRRPFERLFEAHGEPQVRYFRYTLNLAVRREDVPVGLARDVFAIRRPEDPLWGENLLRIHREGGDSGERRVLSIEALLPRRGVEELSGYLEGTRERILDAVGELLPFLREALLVIDSPHDGRPPTDGAGTEIEIEGSWSRGPSVMRTVHGYPLVGALGVAALPVRTPLRRLLLCNEQVLPGLGEEGELLAAWAAARVVTRSDKRKERMRRGVFTKTGL